MIHIEVDPNPLVIKYPEGWRVRGLSEFTDGFPSRDETSEVRITLCNHQNSSFGSLTRMKNTERSYPESDREGLIENEKVIGQRRNTGLSCRGLRTGLNRVSESSKTVEVNL